MGSDDNSAQGMGSDDNSAQATISVPDGGTILLGGVKRFDEMRGRQAGERSRGEGDDDGRRLGRGDVGGGGGGGFNGEAVGSDLLGTKVPLPYPKNMSQVMEKGLLKERYGVASADGQWIAGKNSNGVESNQREVMKELLEHKKSAYPLAHLQRKRLQTREGQKGFNEFPSVDSPEEILLDDSLSMSINGRFEGEKQGDGQVAGGKSHFSDDFAEPHTWHTPNGGGKFAFDRDRANIAELEAVEDEVTESGRLQESKPNITNDSITADAKSLQDWSRVPRRRSRASSNMPVDRVADLSSSTTRFDSLNSDFGLDRLYSWGAYAPPMPKKRSGSSKGIQGVDTNVDGIAIQDSVFFDLPSRDYLFKAEELTDKQKSVATGINETTAIEEAFSTFSLHVSDVSFKLAQAALAQGEWPEAAKIRIEEFVNALDYRDPMPCHGEKVACSVEQAIHPFLQQRNLLRVSMRTAAAGRASQTPLRLTFLLDNSGSMERIDRQQAVRQAFALLAQQLKPIDQVTLISFARQPRLLADKVSGAQSGKLVELIDQLPSEGGTNIEAALQLAFEKAREQQADGAQNRVVLLTDGAVNLGDANPNSLSQIVDTMRDTGIAFDAAGISAEGLNDEVLEALTRKGDGRYYLLDSIEDADDGFASQIAGALRPSAKNVKVQVEFNPDRVGHYKLLGFEKHRLKKEDFRNDKVDAAEMAAAEAGVAVYQFEAKPDGVGDVGSVSVRFRDLSNGQMVENRWPIPYEADAPRLDQAAPSLRIATSAAMFAAKLRGEPLGETVDLQTLSNLISGLPQRERSTKRIEQLGLMIQQARQVSGK